MRVAINSVFAPWDQSLCEGDHVAFIASETGK
ncbi:ubiquitin family protein [Komagataeibacter medellinensis]|nr:hypothetical protein [Komagataeibacter medellinensis]